MLRAGHALEASRKYDDAIKWFKAITWPGADEEFKVAVLNRPMF
jgi:hypothetical protein